MTKTKKIGRWVKLSVVFVAFMCLLFVGAWVAIPNVLKNYIETNDEEWINREITVEKISVNLFEFSIKASDVKVSEVNSQFEFSSCKELYLNMELLPLIKSNFNFEEITLDQFNINITQTGERFNFSDLFESTKEDSSGDKPINFKLENVNFLRSKVFYKDAILGNEMVLDSITISEKSFSSNDDVLDAVISFHQPQGGSVSGNIFYHLINKDYKFHALVKDWELVTYKDYVTSVIQLKEFQGKLNADLDIVGNAKTNFLKTSGEIGVKDINIVDPESKPLLSIGEFFVDIIGVDTKENKYDFKQIKLDSSFVNFEYLSNGDNFSKWLVGSGEGSDSLTKKTSKYYVSPFEMLSVYIYDMTKEYIFKSYTAQQIKVSNFNLKFYDYTLEDPFHMDLTRMNITSENIKPENQFADFNLNGKVNNTGELEGEVSVSRQGIENMTVDMTIKDLILSGFSPYGRFYTAHRFVEGDLTFGHKSVIKDSYLTSTNDFFVESILVSKKDKTSSGYSLPLRLAVAIIKDVDGNVHLDIPVEGPINDPEYKFGKVILQVVKNLLTKLVKSPTKALSNALKVDEDDLKSVYFDNGQKKLSPLQKKPLDKIANVLKKKKEFNIAFNHLYNKTYELDVIALKMAKTSYLKQSNVKLNEEIPIGKQAFDLPSSDPGFVSFLKAKTPNFDETISIPENSQRFVGEDFLKGEFDFVIEKQKQLIKNYLVTQKGISPDRFTIKDLSSSKLGINQTRPKFDVQFMVD